MKQSELMALLLQEKGKAKLSDEAFCKRLGISSRTLLFWENEGRHPGARSLRKILVVFPHLKEAVLSFLADSGGPDVRHP